MRTGARVLLHVVIGSFAVWAILANVAGGLAFEPTVILMLTCLFADASIERELG